MHEPTFRQATIADLEILLRFNQALNEHDGMSPDYNGIQAGFTNLIGRPDWGQIWLIQIDNKPVGYLILTWGYSIEFGGRDAFIDELYLISEARGQGLGQRLLQFAAEQCQANGIRAVHLEVDSDNLKAQAAYDRAGFERRGDYFLMTKYLTPAGEHEAKS